nr:cytochrome P450 [Nonomuraea rhizosphaerae]
MANDLIIANTTEAMFGMSIEPAAARAIHAAMPTFIDNLMVQAQMPEFLRRLPLPSNRRFRAATRQIHQVVDQVISHKRGNPSEREDLIGMLLSSREASLREASAGGEASVRGEASVAGETSSQGRCGEAGMSDRQIHDEAMGIFLAGIVTTANALAWTLHEFARHPDVEERILAEVRSVFGDAVLLEGKNAVLSDGWDVVASEGRGAVLWEGRGPVPPEGRIVRGGGLWAVGGAVRGGASRLGGMTLAEAFKKLDYTRRAVQEVLRLHPVLMVLRHTTAPLTLAGVRIPPGTEVGYSPTAIHRDPHVYPEPHRLDPDRWLGGEGQGGCRPGRTRRSGTGGIAASGSISPWLSCWSPSRCCCLGGGSAMGRGSAPTTSGRSTRRIRGRIGST